LNEEIIETAKATQEVAKTTCKGIEATEKFGSFIAKYISGSLEQGMGIFEDKLKYMRWERQIRLINKAEEVMKSRGLVKPSKPIPLKLAIPLFESASLEDDSYIQDLWVNLLVNSSSDHTKFSLERSYINVLEQLTTLEAKILVTIYSHEFEVNKGYEIQTSLLPDQIIFREQKNLDFSSKTSEEYQDPKDPNDTIKLALSNLSRLQCLKLAPSLGQEIYAVIHPTLFGAKLYEAIQ